MCAAAVWRAPMRLTTCENSLDQVWSVTANINQDTSPG